MGGMAAFKAAGTGRFDLAVAIYGMIRIPEPWKSPRNVEPLEALARPGACPTLAIIAGQDRWTPPEDDDWSAVVTVLAQGAEWGGLSHPGWAEGISCSSGTRLRSHR